MDLVNVVSDGKNAWEHIIKDMPRHFYYTTTLQFIYKNKRVGKVAKINKKRLEKLHKRDIIRLEKSQHSSRRNKNDRKSRKKGNL